MLKKGLLCGVLAFVVINPLVVCAMQNHTMMHEATSDAAITAKIKALYARSSLIKSSHISVTTTNQQVILAGKVRSDLEYERAIALAESVKGVSSVNADHLFVKSSKSPLTDTYITAKVKGKIMKERLFGKKDVEYWPVSVETKDGAVYMTGTVSTEKQRLNIIKLAKSVDGVKSVDSSITVK